MRERERERETERELLTELDVKDLGKHELLMNYFE